MARRSISARAVTRVGAVLAALYCTGGMGWLLLQPGFYVSRVVLSLVVLAAAWGGAVGVLRGRPGLALLGGVVLFATGFWQAVLWIVLLPAAVVLIGGAAVRR